MEQDVFCHISLSISFPNRPPFGKVDSRRGSKGKYCGVDPKRRVGSGVSVCLNNLLACFQHFYDTDEDDERGGLDDPRKQVDCRRKQASERLGIMMKWYICRRERPKASALSYWLLGIEMSAPLTRSPISAVPHKMKTMIEAANSDRLISNALVMPK